MQTRFMAVNAERHQQIKRVPLRFVIARSTFFPTAFSNTQLFDFDFRVEYGKTHRPVNIDLFPHISHANNTGPS